MPRTNCSRLRRPVDASRKEALPTFAVSVGVAVLGDSKVPVRQGQARSHLAGNGRGKGYP